LILLRSFIAALCLCASAGAWAGLPVFCEKNREITAAEQDRALRFAGAVKAELERSGTDVAVVSRAGLDLSRFGLLYSHAGIALKDNPGGAWAVRQLYYACDESRPRLFDQGMSGFVFGADTPGRGHVALLFLPAADSTLLARAALDKRLALALLANEYSANAYAFATRYQNCNQWVAELIATAWGGLDDTHDLRERAQHWLAQRGYEPPAIELDSHWLMAAAPFVPLIHLDDHPQEDLQRLRVRTSLPPAIEAFVRETLPGARRIEMCHDGRKAVIRHGWKPIAEGCRPQAGDRSIDLDAGA
jgi:hypothetical protein